MISEEKLLGRLEKVMTLSQADETEIVCWGTESGLTRFANSTIHQNVYENNCQVHFRSILGKRVGLASTSSLTVSDLRRTMSHSYEIAGLQRENPSFPGLAKPAEYRQLDRFDETTARFTPRKRAAAVKKIITIADRKDFTVAGSVSTTVIRLAVLNSKGLRAYKPVTFATAKIIAMSENSSGYAAGYSHRVDDLDFKHLAQNATDKCELAQNPVSVEPAEYEVILEPPAVADLLTWLGMIGFRSKPFNEKTSFIAINLGKKIMSDKITIYDDAFAKQMIGFPFDCEGVSKKKIFFIHNGVAKGAVQDRISAHEQKTYPTGHAIPPDNAYYGAMAWNICMSPGKSRRNEMISGIKKGILVTRFHYVRGRFDSPSDVLTGMTRDGTFLIENGEIRCGIKNLRFTDSVSRAFSSTVALSKKVTTVDPEFGSLCITAPTMHLGSFRFTGKTEF